MNYTAEQIVKGLMRHGIRVTVTPAGDLSLRGNTASLTENQRLELRRHKPEIVHYLRTMPFPSVVLYVASDLEHWHTTEPHHWADKLTICGKQFVRLTPEVVAWFKERIANAEIACDAGRLPVEDFAKIIRAFCPVYEFAIRVGMIPDPVPREVREQARVCQ